MAKSVRHKKAASKSGISKLKAITAKAKLIRKAHPNKKWTDCIKQASRSIGATKLIEKGETKRTPAKKVLRVNRSKKGTFKGVSVVHGIAGISKKDFLIVTNEGQFTLKAYSIGEARQKGREAVRMENKKRKQLGGKRVTHPVLKFVSAHLKKSI